ncbi:hypothetical protein H696_02330 [Fonticula alba]|uniref:Coronin n=1 Tax=Fonticula alba TaxID=691883 RepID=A0A058ZAG9_FONAL|nr:hypothetical protein H696_02330 [Fonticula alba]KCV71379.1 hypothetical protein H696_02330 [Fonticula alba]|eukprot:XP_009494502.1 hypothetical protein H696_02330 [Fonticula alba]
MWRQASKYRHAVPTPGKPEASFTDLTLSDLSGSGVGISEASHGIAASTAWIALPVGSRGDSFGVLPLDRPGRAADVMVTLPSAHGGQALTDLAFSPFDSNELCTSAADGTVRLWRVTDNGPDAPSVGLVTELLGACGGSGKPVEVVRYNPTAKGILAAAGGFGSVAIFDVSTADGAGVFAPSMRLAHKDATSVNALSWDYAGSRLATTSTGTGTGGQLNVIDPRTAGSFESTNCHMGPGKQMVEWLGTHIAGGHGLLTTGRGRQRESEIALWDARSLGGPLTRQVLDSSGGRGAVLPLFDPDTGMLLLAGKGDQMTRWYELVDRQNDWFSWAGAPSLAQEPQRSATLVPKAAMNVMTGEVVRMLRVTSKGMSHGAIVPLSFTVPRKSYADFHEDIFPETRGQTPGGSAAQWLAGADTSAVPLVSLDPARRAQAAPTSDGTVAAADAAEATAPTSPASAGAAGPAAVSTSQEVAPAQEEAEEEAEACYSPTAAAAAAAVRFSRPAGLRFTAGRVMTEASVATYTHMRDVAIRLTGETDALFSSEDFLAFPLSRPGGQVAVLPTQANGAINGRQAEVLSSLLNKADVLDMAFDPASPSTLVCACEDATIRVWHIPTGGLPSPAEAEKIEPAFILRGHHHRVSLVRFSDSVRGLLASASPEGDGSPSVRLWDVVTGTPVTGPNGKPLIITGFKDAIFDVAFSSDGLRLAVTSRDKVLRVFDARTGALLNEGPLFDGVRGSRVFWLRDTGYLVAIGSDRASNRQLRVYDSANLSKHVASQTLDCSPSVLVPHLDQDTGCLFLASRGDAAIHILEVLPTAPFVQYHSRFDVPDAAPLNGFSFHRKAACRVRDLEIARCYRLARPVTSLAQTHQFAVIDQLSFTVPRSRPEFFQDDLFPATRDRSKPIWSSIGAWLAHRGPAPAPAVVDLCPAGMVRLSVAPPVVQAKPKYFSRAVAQESETERSGRVLNDMFANIRAALEDDPTKLSAASQGARQEDTNVVSDSEWDD